MQMYRINQLCCISLVLFFLLFLVDAQSPSSDDAPISPEALSVAQRKFTIIIIVFCFLLVLSSILVIYAKFFHSAVTVRGDHDPDSRHQIRPRNISGVDREVINSLPFFKFSSLKGSKQWLECAVCLSKFEDIEIIRLLPKCKHAFHIDCIDQWLEKHSNCPLCRQKVSAEDPTIFTDSNSMRFLLNQSNQLKEDTNIEFQVQIEQENHGLSRYADGESRSQQSQDTIQHLEV